MARPRLRVVERERPRSLRVLGYARVSSEEQTRGTSLEDQKKAIRSYAASLGIPVATIYVEAESGAREHREHREQMTALMREVRSGDLVVCHKLDRWSRDVAFSYSSVEKIVAAGADFYLLTERCGPHDENWDAIFGVHALVAKLEHKRIRERLVGTRKLMRDAGLYVEGLPPYGYRRRFGKGERGDDKNALLVDDTAAAKVREAYRLCIAGFGLDGIAEQLQLGRDRVRSVLRSRHYLGQVKDSAGQWIAGRHPAIITPDVWQRANDALDARRLAGDPGRPETDGWMLREIARCARCDAKASAAYGKKFADGSRHHYYRCSRACGAPFVRVDVVELAAEALVLERLEELREELAREPVGAKVIAPGMDIATKRARLDAKRTRLVEAFGDGDITREQLREANTKIDAELLRLDAAQASLAKASPLADPAARRKALASVGAIRRAWEAATPATRRTIIGHLARAVRVERGAAPAFVWRSADELAERV
jgi:site-specific DNA recombinase